MPEINQIIKNNQRILISWFHKFSTEIFSTDRQTDRPTDRPTFALIEAPCRSLKSVWESLYYKIKNPEKLLLGEIKLEWAYCIFQQNFLHFSGFDQTQLYYMPYKMFSVSMFLVSFVSISNNRCKVSWLSRWYNRAF